MVFVADPEPIVAPGDECTSSTVAIATLSTLLVVLLPLAGGVATMLYKVTLYCQIMY